MNTEHTIRILQGADIPSEEPEQKSSGLWMYGVLVIALGLFGWAAYRAVLAWMAV